LYPNPLLNSPSPRPDLRTRWARLSLPKKVAVGAFAVVGIPAFLSGVGQGLGQSLAGSHPTVTVTVTATATVRVTMTATPMAKAATAKPTPPKPTPPSPTAGDQSVGSNDASTGGSTDNSSNYPVLLSPSGHYYHAGEFCPHADDDVTTVDSAGTPITCSDVNGYYRWHY
jgi:hypothetical protein